MLVDVHSHIQLPSFDEDRDDLVKEMGLLPMRAIVVGIDEATSKKADELATKNDFLFSTAGIHPLEETGSVSLVEKFFTKKKCVAVGECGLDYTRTDDLSKTKREQQTRFQEHIDKAAEYKLPLMIHSRTKPEDRGTSCDAHLDVIAMLTEAKKKYGDKLHPHIHFFTESCYVREYLDLGATFSFSGVITFVPEYVETVKLIPLEFIMSETDSPYASPHPKRGRRNSPLNVLHIVDKISEIKGVSKDVVISTINKNAERVFFQRG